MDTCSNSTQQNRNPPLIEEEQTIETYLRNGSYNFSRESLLNMVQREIMEDNEPMTPRSRIPPHIQHIPLKHEIEWEENEDILINMYKIQQSFLLPLRYEGEQLMAELKKCKKEMLEELMGARMITEEMKRSE